MLKITTAPRGSMLFRKQKWKVKKSLITQVNTGDLFLRKQNIPQNLVHKQCYCITLTCTFSQKKNTCKIHIMHKSNAVSCNFNKIKISVLINYLNMCIIYIELYNFLHTQQQHFTKELNLIFFIHKNLIWPISVYNITIKVYLLIIKKRNFKITIN